MKKISKLLAIVLTLAVSVSVVAIPASAETTDFADVAETDYFYPAVKWGIGNGITYGVDEEHFDPQGQVNRAQVVTFLWRMAGQPAPETKETFSDVEAGSWYETAVQWAVENKITAGTGEGMFSPELTCNRAMCLALLYRLEGSPFDTIDLESDEELDENASLEDFGYYMVRQMVQGMRETNSLPDVPEGAYYELPVFWGLFNGILTRENTDVTDEAILFHGEDPCVRGEMISFLYQTKLLEDMKNASPEVYFDDYSLPIPTDYFDSLYFYYYGTSDDDEEVAEEKLLTVSEKASIEAAEAMGEDDTEGIGELFAIIRVSEDRLHELLCGDMPGMKVFANDGEGRFYLFCTPTDVRYVRETNEEMEKDIEQWTELNEWANGGLCDEILESNDDLTAVSFTNTELDIYLARIAYDKYTDYTVSTTEFGELKSKNLDAKPYAEQLLAGNFVEVEDAEAPDGEYVVLNFPEDKVRYDFFTADENLVREVRGNEERFFRRAVEDEESNTGIMQEWYDALAQKLGKK